MRRAPNLCQGGLFRVFCHRNPTHGIPVLLAEHEMGSRNMGSRVDEGRRRGLVAATGGMGSLSPIGAAIAFVCLLALSLIHISEPTRLGMISYAVFCLKK